VLFAFQVGSDSSGSTAASFAQERDDEMVVVPIPALLTLLVDKEVEKGSPLTQREVEALRSKARRMTLPRSVARKLQAQRGYRDLDLNRCWEDWSERRAGVGMPRSSIDVAQAGFRQP
jgi:hypothetical protein